MGSPSTGSVQIRGKRLKCQEEVIAGRPYFRTAKSIATSVSSGLGKKQQPASVCRLLLFEWSTLTFGLGFIYRSTSKTHAGEAAA